MDSRARFSVILVLATATGCPGDDGATTSGDDAAADTGTSPGTTAATGEDPTDTMSSASGTSAGTSEGPTGTSASTGGTTTESTASATGDESGTSGGVVGCAGLDAAACQADPACVGMTGQPIVEGMNGGYCLGEPQFLFCLDAGPPCLPATQTVCMGDMVYEAWSQCGLPEGWVACDPPGDVGGDC